MLHELHGLCTAGLEGTDLIVQAMHDQHRDIDGLEISEKVCSDRALTQSYWALIPPSLFGAGGQDTGHKKREKLIRARVEANLGIPGSWSLSGVALVIHHNVQSLGWAK